MSEQKLFEEVTELPPKKKKKGYHAGDGKFTDKLTARAEQAEKQCKIHKDNEAYYKRQCERLCADIAEFRERNKELEKQLGYGKIFERYDNNLRQRTG